MCGRYTLVNTEHIAERFSVEEWNDIVNYNYNVAPTQQMPVITEKDGKRHVEIMHWGIPRMLGKDTVKELINTRSDKAFGGFWKRTVLSKRCLVPATGFYEWKRLKDGKQPYFIHPTFDDLFAFAGIWDVWKDKDGRELQTYSIMTTEPNKEMKSIHQRMPVILHQADETTWLSSSNNDDRLAIEAVLRPLEDNALETFPVSRDVNVARNNRAELIYPINSQ